MSGTVRSGNSGGPLVDAQGQVVGTVFAATTSGPAGRLRDPGRAGASKRRWATRPDGVGRHGSLHGLS